MRTDLDGWGSFDPEETGFRQLREVFEVAVEKLGQPPIIVDADDLLADPRKILAAYCAAIDVPFDEGLLTWKAGPVTEFKTWSAWHTDAENSNRLCRQGWAWWAWCWKSNLALPDEVEAAIAACLPDYESLHARRIGARADPFCVFFIDKRHRHRRALLDGLPTEQAGGTRSRAARRVSHESGE